MFGGGGGNFATDALIWLKATKSVFTFLLISFEPPIISSKFEFVLKDEIKAFPASTKTPRKNDIIEDKSHSTRAEGARGMAKLTILRHNFSPESFQKILKCERHFVW